MYRIVLIDDDDARVAILRDALLAEGHSVPAILSWKALSWQQVEEC